MLLYTISGSARPQSSNIRLLEALSTLLPQHQWKRLDMIEQLPLFRAGMDQYPWPPAVLEWRARVQEADAVLICTPAYLHNLPALLKNALEWLASSGELVGKPVLPITFTPHAPRGEKAMQSLTWSLQALDARVVTQLPLYQKDIAFDDRGQLMNGEGVELLTTAIELLGQ